MSDLLHCTHVYFYVLQVLLSPKRLVATLVTHKVTHFTAVPSLLRVLASHLTPLPHLRILTSSAWAHVWVHNRGFSLIQI